jgi:hypothetical protein
MMTTILGMVARCSWIRVPSPSQDVHCRKQWRIKLVKHAKNMGSRLDMLDTCGSGTLSLVGQIFSVAPFETQYVV